jgi:hypothetical protein
MQAAQHALFRWDDSTPVDAHPNVGDALARAAAPSPQLQPQSWTQFRWGLTED